MMCAFKVYHVKGVSCVLLVITVCVIVFSGFGQCAVAAVHPGGEDAAAVFGVRWSKDLSEQESRRCSETADRDEEETRTANAGAHREQEGRLTCGTREEKNR